jgi:hypothetical protein
VVSSGKSSAMERGTCWVAQIASWGVAGLVRAGLHVLGLVASRDTAVGLAVVGGAGRSGDDGRGAGGVVRRLSHSGVLMLFLKKKNVTEPIVYTTPNPQARRHSSTPGMPPTNMRLLLSSTRWRLQVTGVGAEDREDQPRASSCQSLSRSVTSDSQGGSEASSIESMNT